jgi:hypothetical protein
MTGRTTYIPSMGKREKLLFRILQGTSDASISFDELCGLLRGLGFSERVKGSHHIFARDGVVEILNLQPRGGEAKAYQVKQVRGVFLKYGMGAMADGQV